MVRQKGVDFCALQNSKMGSRWKENRFERASIKGSLHLQRGEVCEAVEEIDKRTVETLQSAFLKFKRSKQRKVQQLIALTDEKLTRTVRSEEQINKLREKFVEQAKTYLGVPYARRYHEPGSPEYDAPLFLDCCGLVRKILRDMKEDFGFSIGPWNQAYMFDTLPNTVEDVQNLKPGDLVFVSGAFFNPKKRKQRHNMVHVEIWAGEGEKTIGARWQKGLVQIHDSYQYASKSYYNMVYHFKSIDTWLNGTCRSFCSEHSWKSSSHTPGKRSIFSMPEEVAADEPAEELNETEGRDCRGDLFDSQREENGRERLFEKETTVYVERDIHNERKSINMEEAAEKISYTGKQFSGINIESLLPAREKYECENEKTDFEEKRFEQSVVCTGVGREENVVKIQGETLSDERWRGSFENACFCDLCIADSEDSAIKDEESKGSTMEVLDLRRIVETDVRNNTYIDGLRENGLAYCVGSELVPTSDGVSQDNMANKVAQFTSRPNAGGTGAGSTRKQGLAIQAVNRRGRAGTRRRENAGDDDQPNNPREPSRPLCRPNPSLTRLHRKSPTFFIGGNNGAKMVEATLSSLGWKRIHDKNDPTFYLKWVECKRNLDFSSFREGEQLVNHIPNGNLLTTKIGLLTSLQEFDRVCSKVASPTRRGIQMKDFVPETFKLQNQTEIDNFIHHIYQDGEMWICKPTGMNQGKGIFLIRTRQELHEKLEARKHNQGRQRCFPAPGRVVQRYILNPFLLNGYKADIRTYMLIAGTCPYMVFYHPGYVRLSLVPYSLNQEEVHAHLTNQYIQKKHPLYEQVKEETVWSLEQLQEYIHKTSNNALPSDWVFTTFTKRMQEIMLHCFQSVRYKLERKLGYFDLLGFDFMLDENLKVWLIEINVNPALHTNCKILSGVIPELVDSTLKLVVDVFEKSKRGEKILPLENLGKFQMLFSECKK